MPFNLPFIGFGLGFLLLLIPLLWLIISILIAIWVYRDAETRGENGALWLIIVIITGIIGLIIWLVVRSEKNRRKSPERGKIKYCPDCGSEISPNSKYCSECGKDISS